MMPTKRLNKKQLNINFEISIAMSSLQSFSVSINYLSLSAVATSKDITFYW